METSIGHLNTNQQYFTKYKLKCKQILTQFKDTIQNKHNADDTLVTNCNIVLQAYNNNIDLMIIARIADRIYRYS